MITENLTRFLSENRSRNSKEWFQEHRDMYMQYVLNPLFEIVGDLSSLMLSIDPLIVSDPRVDKTVSRIYRDTRFSKDKSLYRDEVWISFTRERKSYPAFPQFFLYITPQKYIYGCGYYAASTESMDSIRSAILNRRPEFIKAFECIEGQNRFVLEGELYKKDKFPDEPEKYKNWLNRKSICAQIKGTDIESLYAPDLTDKLREAFQSLTPFYNFLVYAEESKCRQSWG